MQAHQIIIQDNEVRLDRYLRRLYPYLTQGVIEKALRTKKILVNNNKILSNVRLQYLDQLTIADDLVKKVELSGSAPSFSLSTIKLAEKILQEYKIYDHAEFIVINKPAGLCVQGGSKVTLSIDHALCYLNCKQGQNFKLVHRIDKDTSGVMLIAKCYEAANKLTSAFQKQIFQEQIIKKTYLAVTIGRPLQDSGTITSFIVKKSISSIVYKDTKEKKLAISEYKLLRLLDGGLCLMQFSPLTGRTHQLRIHAQELGCPILGDAKYSNSTTASPYMLLHAQKISLSNEIFGTEILIEAKIPEYFQNLLIKTT